MTLTCSSYQPTPLPTFSQNNRVNSNPPPYIRAQPLLAAAPSRSRSKESLYKLFDIVRDLDGGEADIVVTDEGEDYSNPPPSYTETMAWFTKAKAWGENIAKVLNEDEVRTIYTRF